MQDFLEVFGKHMEFMEDASRKITSDNKLIFVRWCLNFLSKMPNRLEYIIDFYKLSDTPQSLLKNILSTDKAKEYLQRINESLDAMDEYADDFEVIDAPEIHILGLFETSARSVCNIKEASIAICAEYIINILDFHVEFSDNPDLWSELLDKEMENQKLFVNDLINNREVSETKYHEIYDNVDFNDY